MAHAAAASSSFENHGGKGRTSGSVQVCVGLREGPRPLPGRKEEECRGPALHCCLGQLPWTASAFMEKSCWRGVSVFEQELGACGQPLGEHLVGLWSKEAPEASFLHVGFRAQCGEMPALVWVVLWPVSSRPGLGVSSPLHNPSPPAPHLTGTAVPGGDPVGLTWGNGRGPALPSLGTSSPQQKGRPHHGKCLPLGSSRQPCCLWPSAWLTPPLPLTTSSDFASYFPVVIEIKIGTCGLAVDLSLPLSLFFLVSTCIFEILHFMTSRRCMRCLYCKEKSDLG